MNFSSVEFLVLFPVFWLVYSKMTTALKLVALLIASLAFYSYGEPLGLPILLGVVLVTYGVGLLSARSAGGRNWIIGLGVAILLLDLAYFKYAAFLAETLGAVDPLPMAAVLPLGISFFTFEGIAYLMDIRRGKYPVDRSLLRVALYISVFPHLISGPIMRPAELLPQLRHRIAIRLPQVASGIQLFIEGLAKKRLLGDTAGLIADPVFASPNEASTLAAWAAALAYTVQIYADFSGYTDMGRGLARMLGLELPINFNAPYAATSITDFWRRWHISLSRWLRDYLYIGLGGNRRGRIRTYANLLITMLLGGLWHGAGWTFIAWGGYHGVLLALERRISWADHVPRPISVAITILLVVNGWVLFRAHSFDVAVAMWQAMYTIRAGEPLLQLRAEIFGPFAFLGTLVAMMVYQQKPAIVEMLRTRSVFSGLAYGALAGLVFLAAPTSARPFIYFRF